MNIKTSPSVDGMAAVEISLDGKEWKLLAMGVNQRAADVIKESLEQIQELGAEDALNEILATLED